MYEGGNALHVSNTATKTKLILISR